MRERPILFSGAMVRAILADRKTQTRRIAKGVVAVHANTGEPLSKLDSAAPRVACPYGQPGDRLWVRETTVRVEDHGYIGPVYVASQDGQEIIDGGLAPAPDDCTEVEPYEIKLRPAIHMPRSMCRLVLEITDVRVERLQDGDGELASESRYLAEGVSRIHHGDGGYYYSAFRDEPHPKNWIDAFDAWRELWTSINGHASWDADPWVWAITFKRITP